MRFDWSFSLFGKTHIFSYKTIPSPDEITHGITSRVIGTPYHVLFIDYDRILETLFLDQLEWLQDEYHLGNFYTFKTLEIDKNPIGIPTGNYHAINLEVRTLKSIREILEPTSSEYAFKKAPAYNPNKVWVLRQGTKGDRPAPEFMGILESPYEKEVTALQSTAHARYIDSMYGTDIEKDLINPNGIETTEVIAYNTGSRTRLKDAKKLKIREVTEEIE